MKGLEPSRCGQCKLETTDKYRKNCVQPVNVSNTKREIARDRCVGCLKLFVQNSATRAIEAALTLAEVVPESQRALTRLRRTLSTDSCPLDFVNATGRSIACNYCPARSRTVSGHQQHQLWVFAVMLRLLDCRLRLWRQSHRVLMLSKATARPSKRRTVKLETAELSTFGSTPPWNTSMVEPTSLFPGSSLLTGP